MLQRRLTSIANKFLAQGLGEETQRLIWMRFANPDTSTLYVEVAECFPDVAILPPRAQR